MEISSRSKNLKNAAQASQNSELKRAKRRYKRNDQHQSEMISVNSEALFKNQHLSASQYGGS